MNAGRDIERVMEFAICSIVAAEVENGYAALRWVLRHDPENESAREWLRYCADQYGLRSSQPGGTGRLQGTGSLAV